jgi:magnesium transporter
LSGPPLASHDPIYRITPERLVETFLDGFGRPQGLAFDSQGNLYVVDALAGASSLYRIPRGTANPTPELLPRIAVKKRELLTLRRVIGPQREVLAQLTRGEVPFIRESTRIYLRDVLDHAIRSVEMIELYRDLVVGARDIYMSSISNNLNQIMKTLTIITVIALPMTVVTSFFGMNFNTEAIPVWHWILNTPGGFVLSTCVILALIGGLLYVFRRLKWL